MVSDNSLRHRTDRRTVPEHSLSCPNTNLTQQRLEKELQRIKEKMPILHPVKVVWIPGEIARINGQQLLEQVVGDEVRIYSEDSDLATELLAHGCAEWLLNHHSQPYRLMLNKMIELFEQMQYSQKEQIADSIAAILTHGE